MRGDVASGDAAVAEQEDSGIDTRLQDAYLEIVGATAFLTRVPRLPPTERAGAAAFALVGGLMGLAVAVPAALLLPVSPLLAAGTAVGLLALLDGALHLDGVADSADALAAPDREASARARKDPAVGAAGVVALIVVLLLQVAALAAVPSEAFIAALIVAGASSRTVAVVGVRVVPRGGGSLAGWWIGVVQERDAWICLVTCLLVALLLPTVTMLALLAGLGLGLGTLVVVGRAVGVSGDAFGAAIELGFVGALVGAAISGALL